MRQRARQLSAGSSEGIPAWSTEALSLRDRGRAFVVGVLVGANCWPVRYARRRTGRCRTGREASRSALTVTETALAFLEDARRRGELCRPLDWLTEVYHPIGNGEAVIPDALLYYERGPAADDNGAMLRAFVDRGGDACRQPRRGAPRRGGAGRPPGPARATA
jgi:hypothetical protein